MIGIFDSGLGGLTIFKAIEAVLPEYDFIYLGDNARAPYGDHTQETIYQYTTEALEYLFSKGCVLVVLACNTASAKALRKIQQQWLPTKYPDRNVLGVVRPLAEEVAEKAVKNVGVIATRSTVSAQAYSHEVAELNPRLHVYEQQCRLLVPLIEEGYTGKTELRMILKKCLRPLKEHGIDTLILGCTHYGLIAGDVKRYVGGNVNVLDSGEVVARKFKEYLKRHPEYEQRLEKNNGRIFLTTEQNEITHELVKRFLERDVNIEVVSIS